MWRSLPEAAADGGAAHSTSSVECVGVRQARLGLAFGLYQLTMLSTFQPVDWSAKPREKMFAFVPNAHSVPDGLSTRSQAAIHWVLNLWSSAKPRLSSQAALSTFTRLPAWQVVPPFERL